MFNNIAIDVCLGIVFVVLLYSLLATILQEIVARWFGLRARLLQKAMRRMLQDDKKRFSLTALYFFYELYSNAIHYFIPLKKKSFIEAFYKAPHIKYLAESTWNSKPSYIAAESFSRTIIDLLIGGAVSSTQNPMNVIHSNLINNSFQGFAIDEETKDYLKKIWASSKNDIDKFTGNLEDWYNATMERSTGWYKRQTQLILFIIGFVIAYSFNVDLIAITKILAHDDKARSEIVNMAINRQKDYEKIIDSLSKDNKQNTLAGKSPDTVYVAIKDKRVDSAYKMVNEDAANVQNILGLGRENRCVWDTICTKKYDKEKDSLCEAKALSQQTIKQLDSLYNTCKKCQEQVSPYQESRSKYWGWLLTALCISLGAPFWFDLLNKIILLRGSAKATADTSSNSKSNLPPPVKPVG